MKLIRLWLKVLLPTIYRQSYKTFFFGKWWFFRFLLLSLSVCGIRKYCLYLKMGQLKSKNWKNKEIKEFTFFSYFKIWTVKKLIIIHPLSQCFSTTRLRPSTDTWRLFYRGFHILSTWKTPSLWKVIDQF